MEVHEVEAVEAEIAQVCGVINAATARRVRLIGSVLESGGWEGFGIRSPEHWVAWKCGVSAVRARRWWPWPSGWRSCPRPGRPSRAELSGDPVAVVCRHAPAHTDAQMAEFAREATVSQLSRSLASYTFVEPGRREGCEPEEQRRVSFGHRDDGWWQLWALLPADEGALVERALAVAEGEDPRPGPPTRTPSWPWPTGRWGRWRPPGRTQPAPR